MRWLIMENETLTENNSQAEFSDVEIKYLAETHEKKQKKFRHESKNFRFYVIKHIFIAQEQKNSESGKTFGVNL